MSNPADYTSADIVLAVTSRFNSYEDDMTTRVRDFKLKEYLKIALAFLAVIVIGGLLNYAAIKLSPADDYPLLRVLGDALIVAGTLGLTFEVFATKFLIERVSEDVAEKVVGWGLPEKIQGLIREVVNTRIVREDFRKSYRFSEPDELGFMVMEATIEYKAKNYSRTQQPFVPSIQEEAFYSPDFKYFEYGHPLENPKVLTASEIAKLTKVDERTKVKSLFAPKIILSADPKNPKSQCRVKIKYSIRMSGEYSDITSFGGATEGATLELEYIPDGLDFVSGGDATVIHAEESNTWYFDRPFINGQHIRTWWFRKNQPMQSIVRTSGQGR